MHFSWSLTLKGAGYTCGAMTKRGNSEQTKPDGNAIEVLEHVRIRSTVGKLFAHKPHALLYRDQLRISLS